MPLKTRSCKRNEKVPSESSGLGLNIQVYATAKSLSWGWLRVFIQQGSCNHEQYELASWDAMSIMQGMPLNCDHIGWTKCENNQCITKIWYENFGYKFPKFAKRLCTLSNASLMKFGKNRKVGNQGVKCIFVGCALDHDRECDFM